METKKSQKADLERRRPILLSVGMVLSLSFVLFAFSWKTPVKKAVELNAVGWEVPDEFIIPSTKEKKEFAPPVQIVLEFKLVDDNLEIDEPDLEIFNTEITDEGIDVNALINMRKDEKNDIDEKVYVFVDEMPEFPGGMGALLSFIGRTVKYPVVAQENGLQGKVYINFVINTDGFVSDARVVRGVDASLDKEALRVVNSLPKWKPGKQSGRAVRVSFNVPISFVLQ